MTIGLIGWAIVSAEVGGALGALAETNYDPSTRLRKNAVRCMKNRGYEILSDLGKGV